jgi:hypothetical protein
MREMIFNDASLAPGGWDAAAATAAIVDLAQAMTLLVTEAGVARSLRLSREISEIIIYGSCSLYDLLVKSIGAPAGREEARFWLSLVTKYPLHSELPESVKDRFLGCAPAATAIGNHEGLMLCAIQSGIAISLPTDVAWESDQLSVHFGEMLPDGSVVDVLENIDNVAGMVQAETVVARHDTARFRQATATNFWANRNKLFPALLFGVGVEKNIADIGENQFATIMGCLQDLNTSAETWDKGAALEWRRKVTPESASLMANPKLRETRHFKNRHGQSRLYEWHARFGSAGRIHLYADPTDFSVEVGYIGPHLPL